MVKVLFLENTEHQNVGDIKQVPDGYARNYLIPKGIAVLATPEEVSKQEKKIEKIKAEEEKLTAKMTDLAEKIEAKPISITAQAGDEEKLFGAVTNKDIAEALEKAGFEIEKQQVEVLEPIHTLGEHEALVKLGHGIHATVKVIVERAK
jgi:large subunit ribosomal protein L9